LGKCPLRWRNKYYHYFGQGAKETKYMVCEGLALEEAMALSLITSSGYVAVVMTFGRGLFRESASAPPVVAARPFLCLGRLDVRGVIGEVHIRLAEGAIFEKYFGPGWKVDVFFAGAKRGLARIFSFKS